MRAESLLLVCHQCLFRPHPTAQTPSLGGPSVPLGPNEPTSLISLTPRPHHRFLPPSGLRPPSQCAPPPPLRPVSTTPPPPTAPRDAGPRRRLPREGPGLVLRPPGAGGGGRGRRWRWRWRWRPPAADAEGPLARHHHQRTHRAGEGRVRRRLRRGQGACSDPHARRFAPRRRLHLGFGGVF